MKKFDKQNFLVNFKDLVLLAGLLYGIGWLSFAFTLLMYLIDQTTKGSFGPWWYNLNINHPFFSVLGVICMIYFIKHLVSETEK